ncbi:hypothetical protein TNCV_2130911 [Trichonephila clavipes]|nr:hypothetical protein TNCV_2130911 [Trichonephila clavipes]
MDKSRRLPKEEKEQITDVSTDSTLKSMFKQEHLLNFRLSFEHHAGDRTIFAWFYHNLGEKTLGGQGPPTSSTNFTRGLSARWLFSGRGSRVQKKSCHIASTCGAPAPKKGTGSEVVPAVSSLFATAEGTVDLVRVLQLPVQYLALLPPPPSFFVPIFSRRRTPIVRSGLTNDYKAILTKLVKQCLQKHENRIHSLI